MRQISTNDRAERMRNEVAETTVNLVSCLSGITEKNHELSGPGYLVLRTKIRSSIFQICVRRIDNVPACFTMHIVIIKFHEVTN